jgi:hypothetical protein
MSDIEKWIDGEGPEPEAVREVYDRLRADALTREHAEQLERNVLDAIARREAGGEPAPDLPLDFASWAELSALLLGAGLDERLDVLEERGLSLDDWTRCETHYFRSLAADVAAGRVARAELYARLCGEVIARSKALPVAPAPEAPAARAPAAPPPLPPAAAPPPPPDVATFQKIEQGMAPLPAVVQAPDELRGTIRTRELPIAAWLEQGKLPFSPAAPTPAGAPAPPAVRAAPAPPAAPPPPLPAAAPLVRPPPGDVADTLPLGADLSAYLRAPAPAPPAAPPPPPVAAPPVTPTPGDVAGTLPLGADLSAYIRPALPFAGQGGGGDENDFSRWQVVHYASLTVDLEMDPQRRGEILQRYGLKGEAGLAALHQHWQRVLAAEPAKRVELDLRRAQYAAIRRGQAR